MMETLGTRASNLLTVKSLVTLALTIAFVYQVITGEILKDFMTIYMAIITFYFTSQTENKK